jgi:hypothetical protein
MVLIGPFKTGNPFRPPVADAPWMKMHMARNNEIGLNPAVLVIIITKEAREMMMMMMMVSSLRQIKRDLTVGRSCSKSVCLGGRPNILYKHSKIEITQVVGSLESMFEMKLISFVTNFMFIMEII